jgi:hypothetical protein
MNSSPVKYKFYATLLDSFAYYLSDVDNDDAFQNFIDKLNRVPFKSDAADKGSAFNELIDSAIGFEPLYIEKGNYIVTYKDNKYKFKKNIVDEIVIHVKGCFPQLFVSGVLKTNKGNVELYGYLDYLNKYKIIDLKTTGRYTFPKYLSAWQKKIYPYCLNEMGIKVDTFEYLVTDFSNIYIEEYPYKPKVDIPEIAMFTEQLIDFIELNRNLITDQKLFNLA